MTKQVTFNVSKGFVVPDYSEYSTDLIERALSAGFGLIHDTIRLWRPSDDTNGTREEKFREAYEIRLEALKQSHEDYKKTMQSAQDMQLQSKVESYRNQLESLNTQMAAMQSRAEEAKAAHDEYRKLMQGVQEAQLETNTKSLRSQIESLNAQLAMERSRVEEAKTFQDKQLDSRTESFRVQIELLNTQVALERARVEELRTTQKAQLDEKTRFLLSQVDALTSQIASHEDYKRQAQENLQRQLHSSSQELQTQIRVLQSQIETERARVKAMEYIDTNMEKLASKVKTKVSDTLDEFGETLEPFRRLHDKSIKKGEYAEDSIENMILAEFPNASIVDTSARGNSGDRQLDLRKYRYLIEVKNMARVQKSHVEEFERVIGVNAATIHAGIFISWNCPIPDKGELCIELIGDIPVAYIQLDHESRLTTTIEVLHEYCNLACKFRDHREASSRTADNASIDMKAMLRTTFTNVSLMLNMCEPLRQSVHTMIGQIDKYERHAKTILSDATAYMEKYPTMKLEAVDIVSLEQKEAARGFTDSEIDKIMFDGSTITTSNVLRILGQGNAAYIKARGGMTKLKAIIASRRKEKEKEVSSDSDDDTPTYTDKELSRLAQLGKRPNLKEAMATLKKEKDYIKKRGGMKALYERVLEYKKRNRKTKPKKGPLDDLSSSDDSDNSSDSSDSD